MSQSARSDSQQRLADPIRSRRPVLIFIGVLIAIMVTSYGVRIATDAPFLASGTLPEPEDFESRYVAHPWLAYLHMTPGVIYLLGAPLQLSERFRTKHYTVHRRLGRILVSAALLSGALALVFGLRFAWGGTVEAMATASIGGASCSGGCGGNVLVHIEDVGQAQVALSAQVVEDGTHREASVLHGVPVQA